MVLPRILFGGAFTIAASYSLGRLCLRWVRAPKIMALPLGAAILSLVVYVLLLSGIARAPAFLALGVLALLPMLWRDRRTATAGAHEPVDRVTAWILTAVFAGYGVLYTVHALAPEIQPDAAGYHLGLVAEYFRLGTFPDRIDFYGILPQGMEMLYLFAFAFGGHSAAKLVHFAFLISTAPVLLAVGRRLGISDTVCWVAAAFYLCAPVVGVSATSAYTDAALVCCILATLYFLIAWLQEDEAKYLIPAGVLAGFCYAIKLNALIIPALAGLFVLVACRRNPKAAVMRAGMLAGASAVMILPWMIRSVVLTRNPVAPLFNAWFPNPYFLAATENSLATLLRNYEGFTFLNAPWELTVGGSAQGILGPLFLFLPVGLLALRQRAGRLVWLAGGLLALPWFANMGTRFLMPSLPFFALALALTLPRRAAWAALVFHAVASWPAVITSYDRISLWRLRGFPWEAAMRLTPERDYLRVALTDVQIAEMLTRNTRVGSKILGLVTVSGAYLDRDVVEYWQSAAGVRAREQLLEAYYVAGHPLYDWGAEWKAQKLTGVRFRLPTAQTFEWEIHEAEILRDEDRIPVDTRWRVAAWPNLYEALFAVDGGQGSRWRTWVPAPAGSFLEVELGTPQIVTGARLTTHWVFSRIEMFGKRMDGKWIPLASNADVSQRLGVDMRKLTILNLKRAGFEYIVTAVGDKGNAGLGKYLTEHAAEWGIIDMGGVGTVRLLKL
jgi:4-amino-4-deoxy-L-arabinose transferase-like glycosyltransferase